jgi:hypothetical protein
VCSGVYKPPQTVHRSKGARTASCVVSIFKTGLIVARGNALNLGTMKPVLQTEGVEGGGGGSSNNRADNPTFKFAL